MKTICFYFQIHQPFRLKRYRFFDIGNDHYYYDDFQNEEIIHRIAEQCYLPANRTILEMIKTSGGKFKVAFSIRLGVCRSLNGRSSFMDQARWRFILRK